MTYDLTGKRAIVTGASRGLGAAIKAAFEAAGAEVYAPERTQYNFLYHGRGERVILAARQKFPSIEIVVNNAAIIGPTGDFWETKRGEWQDCLQVNLLAPMEMCAHAIWWMKETGTKGSIINISGGGACNPRPGYSAYATSKAGLVRFSETVAEECRESGIRVNCVSPGAMATGMRDRPPEDGEIEARMVANIANATQCVTWLASDASRPITGKLISAVWDPWPELERNLSKSDDMYTLRRVTP